MRCPKQGFPKLKVSIILGTVYKDIKTRDLEEKIQKNIEKTIAFYEEMDKGV